MIVVRNKKEATPQLSYKKRANLILQAPAPKNGQTHSSNSSAVADKLFECV